MNGGGQTKHVDERQEKRHGKRAPPDEVPFACRRQRYGANRKRRDRGDRRSLPKRRYQEIHRRLPGFAPLPTSFRSAFTCSTCCASTSSWPSRSSTSSSRDPLKTRARSWVNAPRRACVRLMIGA